jgi:hypothetical protein
MPIKKLRLMPGVDLQSTPTLNQTQWAVSQLIRFYKGLLQKIGGWQHFSAVPVIGTCRALHGWADLSGVAYVATGTEQRLQVLVGGTPQDITPIIATSNITPAFSTTSGSAQVTIADTYAPSPGDWMNLITEVSVGGTVLLGYYRVVSVGSGNYVVTAANNATANVSNGGAVPSFTTGTGSPTVTVGLANHGLTVGANFNVPLTVNVGGLALLGTYAVVTVPNANQFTITAAANAGSVATVSLNSGNAQILYLLPSGGASSIAAHGYGVGLFGSGYYGLANGSGAASNPPRVWALDHYGTYLVGAPNGGTIYYWPPGQTTPATVVPSTPPLYNNWILSVPAVQMLMALGSESGGTQYPLLVKWCDASGLLTANGWVPTAINQAGSFQLNSGSTLLFGAANGLTIYLWTDLGVWNATYQGLPYVFSFNEVARECGAISARAVAIAAMGAAWLSPQGFFIMSGGGVQPMTCPVWDYYNDNVDTTQLPTIFAALNTEYHEVSWFFPLVGGGFGYVKWNWLDNVWDYGTLIRTAWMDASPAGNAMGVDAGGLIQQHELGNDADGQPIEAYAHTGYFDVDDGAEYVFCDMLIPDFVASDGATVNLTVFRQDYPEAVPGVDGPYAMQFFNANSNSDLPQNFVVCNSRGRQLAIGIRSLDAGSTWRLGALRYQYTVDGAL